MLPENLDLKKLKAFQITATHGGLKVAAGRLHLSVPAVSFQIRRLEEELGVELFQRSPSGLVLTKIGERFLSKTTTLFENVEDALSDLTPDDTFSGELSLSTGSDIGWYFTPRISRFIKRYPGVQLRHHVYNSAQTLKMVSSGSIDVGIGYFPRIPPSLEKETVTTSALSLLCPRNHPLVRRMPVRPDDIARHKMVLPPGQSTTRRIIDNVFHKTKIKPRDVIEVGSCQAARDFVANGVGLAIVHSFCVSQGQAADLRQIDISGQFGSVDFSIIYRRESSNSPLVRGLLEELDSSED